jgi:WbqC-like protein family
MQPYFFPYAGYFRLFAVCDVFIIFDCVQFPRRGRVHRSQIGGSSENPAWLTLPMARQPRETLIGDLAFAPDAQEEFRRRLERVTWINEADGPSAEVVRELLYNPISPVIDYLESGLRMVAGLLEFDVKLIRSSRLAIDPALRGKDRVIAIASAVGAQRYVNPPGGRLLYDAATFADANIELRFLSSYTGRFTNMLPALMTEQPRAIRKDIIDTSSLEAATPHRQR